MSNELPRIVPPGEITVRPEQLGAWLVESQKQGFLAGFEAGVVEYVDLEGWMPPTVEERHAKAVLAFQAWVGPKTEKAAQGLENRVWNRYARRAEDFD